MRKIKALLAMAVLVSALWLCWKQLEGYVTSSGYEGVTFQEEAAGHGGIYLEGSSILVSDQQAIQVEDTTVTITSAGKYEISGTLDDGQIIVDAGDEDDVTLELNDASVTCSYSAPIWVKNAGNVKIKLPEDSLNFLSDGEFYDFPDSESAKPSACLYSSADLIIKGKGSLTVTANYRSGIVTTDDLEVRNGILNVTAPKDALRGKDSVTVTGGILNLNGGESALSTSGAISMSDCTARLKSDRYGLKAVSGVTLEKSAALTVEAPMVCGCPAPVTGLENIYLPFEGSDSQS